eukprot:gene12539-33120_t
MFVRRIDGEHLEIDRKGNIGAGSFGAVFRARWKGPRTPYLAKDDLVAVKLPFHCKDEEGVIPYAGGEAGNLSGLRHRNIVTFYGTWKDPTSGNVGLVTEYCDGGSLNSQLRFHRGKMYTDDGGINDKELIKVHASRVLPWVKDIVAGMDYLHRLAGDTPFVHRDLKSANVLCGRGAGGSKHGLLKICDFGAGKQYLNTTQAQLSVAGTYAWMAPDLYHKHIPTTEKIDVWSFGVILWELLTLEVPHGDVDNAFTIIHRIGNNIKLTIPDQEYTPNRFGNPLKRCWKLKPEERPSFEELGILFNSFDVAETEVYSRQDGVLLTQLRGDGCRKKLIMNGAPKSGLLPSPERLAIVNAFNKCSSMPNGGTGMELQSLDDVQCAIKEM